MKICVAQTKPVTADIQTNIDNHKKLIDLAVSNAADTIIFPELSLTGYEPALAKDLATNQNDNRFDDFQKISDAKHITIGVGIPIKTGSGILISMIIFQPWKPRQIYSKQYLHSDELPYFVNGRQAVFLSEKKKISLAICYEISVPEHLENVCKNGAEIYIASVAKSVNGIDKALTTLSDIAKKYSMTVLMSNCIGDADGFECAGKTSIWNNKGSLLAQLNDKNEGILVLDTDTRNI